MANKPNSSGVKSLVRKGKAIREIACDIPDPVRDTSTFLKNSPLVIRLIFFLSFFNGMAFVRSN